MTSDATAPGEGLVDYTASLPTKRMADFGTLIERRKGRFSRRHRPGAGIGSYRSAFSSGATPRSASSPAPPARGGRGVRKRRCIGLRRAHGALAVGVRLLPIQSQVRQAYTGRQARRPGSTATTDSVASLSVLTLGYQ
jgi:hypothetical protein